MRKVVLLLLLMLPIVSFCEASGQSGWMGVKDGKSQDGNRWYAFRGHLTVDDIADSVVVDIAVDSKYWLWINNKLVIFEGGLKRGPNPKDTYFDKLEISEYLKKGDNIISVLVWYWGKNGFSHNSSGKPGLFFESNQIDNIDWKGTVHPAYGKTGKPHPNYRLPESNIHFDARSNIEGWQAVDYNDSDWEKVTSLGDRGDLPWGNLIERPIPQWHNSGLISYTLIEKEDRDSLVVYKCYLPKNITITPYLDVSSNAGELIDIRTDNYKGGGASNVRAEYITKDGDNKFESYAYMNGHYVIYTMPKGVEVNELRYRETRYDTKAIGYFTCNDPFYNKLYTKAENSLNVNMRDVFQDCPGRERAQWWGDVVILLGEVVYTLDDNGHLLVDKAIDNLFDWQREDGSLYAPVPAGNWGNELPCQMLASVGKFGVWYYYYYTQNEEMLTQVYPGMKRYMSLWELDDSDLVVERKGGWRWLDWGAKIDSSLVYNTWYYMALDAASNMAHELGDKSYEKECLADMKALKQAFNDEYWTGNGYKSPDYKWGYDDRGNALAIVAGLADNSKWEPIAQILNEYENASPYTEKYVLEALFMMGRDKQAMERMKKRYTKMVDSDLTTLWEGWGIGKEGFGGGSYNHGWSGGPLTLMMQYVAGISPTKEDWQEFKIAPELGNLNSVSSKVPVGENKFISVDIQKSLEAYHLDAAFPKRPGVIQLPITGDINELRINGKYVELKKGKSLKDKMYKVLLEDNVLKVELDQSTGIQLDIYY